MNLLAGWLVGFLLGMRHAVEPDHLAAVSTLAVGAPGRGRGMWLGVWWGMGHTLALLSGVLGWPLARVSHHPRLSRAVSLAAGAFSIALGIAMFATA